MASNWEVVGRSVTACLPNTEVINKTSDLLKLLQERNWKEKSSQPITQGMASMWLGDCCMNTWGILIWLSRWFAYCVEPIPCLNRQAVIWGKERIVSFSLMPCQKSCKPNPDAPGRYRSIHVHILYHNRAVTVSNIYLLPGLSAFTAPTQTQILHPTPVRSVQTLLYLTSVLAETTSDNILSNSLLPLRGKERVEGSSVFHVATCSNSSIFSHLLSLEQRLSPWQTCWWEESMPRHTLAA